MSNTTPISFGELSVLGNSDYLNEYEQAAIFQANEHTAVGLNDSTIQLFSATTDNNLVTSIFGFELPNTANNNNQGLKSKDITDTDRILSQYKIAGFDVVQNPSNPYETSPQSQLITYTQDTGGLRHVLLKSDPLSDNSMEAQVVFSFKPSSSFKAIKGFFPCYAGAFADELTNDVSGAINIFVNDTNGNQTKLSLTNYQFFTQGNFATSVVDFSYTYYQDRAGADYLVLAFICEVAATSEDTTPKNIVNLIAYNRADATNNTSTSYLLPAISDSFNPLALESRQNDEGFPQMYLAGNLDGGGYSCYELNCQYDTGSNALTASVAEQFSTTNGTLIDFNIGQVVKGDTSSLEFWGMISTPGQKGNMLMNAIFTNNAWSSPFPIMPVTRYEYLCDRISGISSVFVSPESTDTTPSGLVHFWMDPQTKSLRSNKICLPDITVRKYGASATYLNFTLNDPHTGTYPLQLSITASATTYVKINGTAYCLSKTPTAINTDAKGRLKIIREAAALEGEDFYISHTGAKGYLKVVTRANAQSYLASRKLPGNHPDLDKANQRLSNTITDKNSGSPLLALSVVSDTLSMKNKLGTTENTGLTFTGYSFRQGQVKISTSQQEFDQLKLSQHILPPLGGILDDLYDDFKSAWNDLKNDVSKFCMAAENFIGKITDIVIDTGKMVVHFAEDVVEVVLNTVEDIWKAIKFVFKTLADIVKDLISFLGAFFEILESIKPTAQALTQIFTVALDQLGTDLGSQEMKNHISSFLSGLNQKLPRTTVQTSSASTGAHGQAAHNSFFESSAVNFIISHVEDVFGSSDSSNVIMSIAEDAFDFADDAIKTVTDAITGVYDIISNLDDFNQQVQKLSQTLEGDVHQLLADMEQLIVDLFEAILDALQGLIDLLKANIDIPVISDIYEYLVGDQLSVVSLVSMVLAVPTAVLFGVLNAIEGKEIESPFASMNISDIKTFGDLINLMYQGNNNTGISTLLPFGANALFDSESTRTTPTLGSERAVTPPEEENEVPEGFIKAFGIAGLANSFLSYFLFAMDKAAQTEQPPGKYKYGFKISGLILTCVNGSLSMASSKKGEMGLAGFLSGMKVFKALIGLISPTGSHKESDAEVLSGIQGVFSLICLLGFFISEDKEEDALKIIHPTIDYIAEFALEKKEFPVSLLVELIALAITFAELVED